MTIEEALAAADAALTARITTIRAPWRRRRTSAANQIAAVLLEAGCLGMDPSLNGFAADCPLVHWFTRFLQEHTLLPAGAWLTYNGSQVDVWRRPSSTGIARWAVSPPLQEFALRFDDHKYPRLIRAGA